jgi:alpha-ketoglutarate-dependent taurine dioxygenase
MYRVENMSIQDQNLNFNNLSIASQRLIESGKIARYPLSETKEINGLEFPLVLTPVKDQMNTKESCLEWFAQYGDTLREAMRDHGAIFFRGFPLHGAFDFEQSIDAATFKEMPYVGGAAPREVVTARRILTANESPPDQPIPFHHEMAQVPQPPGYVFFYCETAPKIGGATPIVHSHKVYQRFESIDAHFCKDLEKHGAKYIRVMPFDDDPSSPIGRSWRATFQVQSEEVETAQQEAEQKMSALGTTWRWLDDGTLYTESASVPAIRVDKRTGMKTFFNSVVAAYTGWSDKRNDPTQAVRCGDGSAVNGDALLTTAKAMREEQVAITWQPQDMMWIDNHLTMHSRQPYQGDRRILAAIAPQ